MSRWFPVLIVVLFLSLLLPSASLSARAQAGTRIARSPAAAPTLRVSVQPPKINVGRDVSLKVLVTDSKGKPVAGALVTITGVSLPVVGTAPHGVVILKVRAQAVGVALVQASHAGYSPTTFKAPIVPGPPATVTSIKRGMFVLAPHRKPIPGKVGADLFEQYHGLTGKGQYASLGLRDGTLVDLNADTDVLIRDPLHVTLSKGELFLEVVHGGVSHQVQVGSAVVATKGTRLDVKVDAKTKATVVTVVEGQVLVSNRKVSGSTANVLVGAGQQSTVLGSKPPSPPKPVDLNKLLSWIHNLPNTNKTTVPPVLNLPPPRLSVVPAAPPAETPRITITGVLSSTAWTASAGPYLLTGGVTVPAGVTLTIEPGAVVEMARFAYLTVQGTLKAQGTAAAPIIFTSAAAQPKPGDWQYVRIDGARSTGSIFDHVRMFYGSPNGGAGGMLSLTQGANITVSNSVFAQATAVGVWMDDVTRSTIANCIFAGNGGYAVEGPVDDLGQITGNGFGLGQAGIHLRGGTVSHDAVWQQPDVPYVVTGGTTVAGGVTVAIKPGAVVEMARFAYLTVQGTLKAQGTAANPITFTSAAAQPKPGDWQYIRVDGPRSTGSIFDHVQMFYGSPNGGAGGMLSLTQGANITVSNSVFAQATAVGVWMDDGTRATIANCIFAGNGGYAVEGPVDDLGQIKGSTYGPDQLGTHLRGGAISHDAVWEQPNVPYVLTGGTTVTGGVGVTIAPGAVLEMDRYAYLTVQGTLKAQGTAAAPIIFTSAAAQPKPGDWQYIRMDGARSTGSIFDHVQMFYGSPNGGAGGMLSLTQGANITVSNSVFAQATAVGVWMDDGTRATIANCIFAGDGSYAVEGPVDDLGQLTGSDYGPGQLGIHLRGGTISHDAVWEQPDMPYVLTGGSTVAAGVTVTIAPGAMVEMDRYAYLVVQGTLKARGTATAPITFTSAATQPKPGDWQYIRFDGPKASSSLLDYIQVLYGSANGGASGVLSITQAAAPTITHCLIAHATQIGIWVESGQPTITDCLFRDNGGPAISLPVKDPQHVHDNTFAPGQKGMEIR